MDGNTLVVGAFQDDDADSADRSCNSGSAYVYVDTSASGDWSSVTETKLVASDAACGDYFGGSVAVEGDTVVVGAVRRNSDTGAAYVYAKPATGWTDGATLVETAVLTASGGVSGDQFGVAVAVDGDTVVVGARQELVTPPHARGAVYVYVDTSASGGWNSSADLTETKLVPGDPENQTCFGGAVTISGGVVAAGDQANDETASLAGAVYLFREPAGGWADGDVRTHDVKLIPSDSEANMDFGYSVSLDGNTLVVGAPFDNDACPGISGCYTGSAYVYVDTSNGPWSSFTETKLTASDASASLPSERFGFDASVEGSTVVVAAAGDPGDNAGSAYVFRKPSGGWPPGTTLSAEGAHLDDPEGIERLFLVFSVVTSAGAVAFGVPGDNPGSVFLFDLTGDADADGLSENFEDSFGCGVGEGAITLDHPAAGDAATSSSGSGPGGAVIESGGFTVRFPAGTTCVDGAGIRMEFNGTSCTTSCVEISGVELGGARKSVEMPLDGSNALCIEDSSTALISGLGTAGCNEILIYVPPEGQTNNEDANGSGVTTIVVTLLTGGERVRIDGLEHTAIVAVSDADRDGVLDPSDACPSLPGPAASGGCVPLEISLDIRPGRHPNAIKPRSRGNVPAAVLTEGSFDAASVDPSTVRFGPGGAAPVHGSGHREDVDGDRDIDLVLHFAIREATIACGDSSASLRGKTTAGRPFEGSDSVRTVGCK